MPDPKMPPPPADEPTEASEATLEEWAREQELVDDPETGSASGFGQTEGN